MQAPHLLLPAVRAYGVVMGRNHSLSTHEVKRECAAVYFDLQVLMPNGM